MSEDQTRVIQTEANRKRKEAGQQPGCKPFYTENEDGEVTDYGFICYSYYSEPKKKRRKK